LWAKKGKKEEVIAKTNLIDIFDAAEKGTVKDVRYFIEEKGVDVNSECERRGGFPLHFAARNANIEVARFLVSKGAAVDAQSWGETPLHWAACNEENIDVAKFLVSKGANVNAKTSTLPVPVAMSFCQTPLHVAVISGNVEFIKFLIAERADVNAADDNGSTPLHMAVCSGNVAVAKILVSMGAKVNTKDNKGITPLDFAIAPHKRDSAMVQYLSSVGGC
jgi:ankyrin repeat protein